MTSSLPSAHQPPVPASARTVTDRLLAQLRADRWQPAAWSRLISDASRQSMRDAAMRPRALAEVTALHAVFAAVAPRHGRGRGWVAMSWLLAATHLGLLEHRDRISTADVLTLARANLPALAPDAPAWLAPTALLTDLADGRLARAHATTTVFGHYADTFADAAFWTWYAHRHEPSNPVRIAALAAWVAPVIAVTVTSVATGRMVPAPRPVWVRPAAAMQALLAIRALRRRRSG